MMVAGNAIAFFVAQVHLIIADIGISDVVEGKITKYNNSDRFYDFFKTRFYTAMFKIAEQ